MRTPDTSPDSPDNYNAYKDEQRQQDQKRQQFQAVTRLENDASSPVSDAQLSDHVAELTGSKPAPEDMVRANRELFREAADNAWADGIRDRAPITLAMASDANRGPLSKSAIEAFASIEQTANQVGKTPSAIVDGALGLDARLASALISVPGPRGTGALPPLPLPKPPIGALPPLPLPKPPSGALPPIPLPKPEMSTAIPAQSEGSEGVNGPTAGAPTVTPVEGALPAAPSVGGSSQPSASTGQGTQRDVSGNVADVPTTASAEEPSAAAPSVEEAGQSPVPTGPGVQTDASGNAVDASGATAAQSAPTVPPSTEAAGQGAAAGTPGGQGQGEQAADGTQLAPGRSTSPPPAAVRAGGMISSAAAAADDAFVEAVANGDRESFDKLSKTIDQRTDIPREAFHAVLYGVAFGSLTSDRARELLLSSLGKGRLTLDPVPLSPPDTYDGPVFEAPKPTVPYFLTPIGGWVVVPSDRPPLSDHAFRQGIYYLNALGRWLWGQKQNSEYTKAENAAAIGRDQKRSLAEISADQWAGAPGGSKDAAWGALVGDGREAFVRWMESRQKKAEWSPNYEPGVTLSDMPASYDFGRPGFPPDPAAVYVGLALSNDFDVAARWLKAKGSTFLGWDQSEEAKKHLRLVDEIQGHIDALPMSEAATRFDNSMTEAGKEPTISGQLARLTAAASNDPGGLLAYVTEKGTENIPALAMAAIATAVTDNPAAGIAMSAGLTYRQERSAAALALIKEKGFNLSEPKDIDRLLADSATWEEAKKRGQTRALLVTIADVLSNGVTATKLANNAVVNGLAQYTGASAASMAGETLAQVYSGQKLNAANIALNGAIAVFKTAASKLMDAGLEKLPDAFSKARSGTDNFDNLLQMSAKTQKLLDQGQDPESLRATFAEQMKGSKAKLIFIRANDLDHLISTNNLDIKTLFDPLKGFDRKKFNDALATGGDVYLPTATYLTFIAPKMGAEVSPYIRLGDPSNWNAGETQAFYEAVQEASRSKSEQPAVESSSAIDATPNVVDPATTLPGSNGGIPGGEKRSRSTPDTAPLDPSGATSQGASPLTANATGGSESKAAPNQNQAIHEESAPANDSASASSKRRESAQQAVMAQHADQFAEIIAGRRAQGPYDPRLKGRNRTWQNQR